MKTALLKLLLCSTLVLCTGASLHAQGRGRGGGGMHPGMSGPQHSGFPGMNGNREGFPTHHRDGVPPAPGSGPAGTNSTMRGGLQLGPPGRWWDDKGFARTVGLRKEQRKKMDLIFNANKAAILDSYNTLQREESKLELISRESQPDKARMFAAIDSVNQARAALEKVNAQMLLQIRQEMEPDQIVRMDKFRDKPPEDAAN